MQRRDVRDVATEPSTLFHLLVAETLVGAPPQTPAASFADLDAFALFLAQMIDLGDCFGK